MFDITRGTRFFLHGPDVTRLLTRLPATGRSRVSTPGWDVPLVDDCGGLSCQKWRAISCTCCTSCIFSISCTSCMSCISYLVYLVDKSLSTALKRNPQKANSDVRTFAVAPRLFGSAEWLSLPSPGCLKCVKQHSSKRWMDLPQRSKVYISIHIYIYSIYVYIYTMYIYIYICIYIYVCMYIYIQYIHIVYVYIYIYINIMGGYIIF